MMSPAPAQPPFRIESAAVAHSLRSVREMQYLMAFMRPEGATVTALASGHSLTLNAAYRKVQSFHTHGLLGVLRQERRAGRSVKVYGCQHRSFFIPSSLVSVDEQFADKFEPYRRLIQGQLVNASQQTINPVAGLIMAVQEGELWLLPATAGGERWTPDLPGSPAIVHSSGPLQLDYDEAKALERELHELFDRYRSRQGTGRYLMHLVLAPVAGSAVGQSLPQTGHTGRV